MAKRKPEPDVPLSLLGQERDDSKDGGIDEQSEKVKREVSLHPGSADTERHR